MGLNIGVQVKRQHEAFMSYGYNPKGTREEIQAEFDRFLRGKFPDDTFTLAVELQRDKEMYVFDVHMCYKWNNYDSTPMYLAILEYVLSHFSADYGIDISIYHNP